MVEILLQRSIKVFRSDSGGEFLSNELTNFLIRHGMTHQRSCAYTPQQNGVVEGDAWTYYGSCPSHAASNAPRTLWAEAVNTAVHIINCIPP